MYRYGIGMGNIDDERIKPKKVYILPICLEMNTKILSQILYIFIYA